MKICVKKDKLLLGVNMLVGAVNAVAIAFVSIILQRIVDIAVQGREDEFWKLFITITVYMAGLCLMGFLEAFCGKVLLRNVTRSLRERIFNGVMAKRPQEYGRSNSAEYLSSLVNDVKLVEENYLTPLLLSVQMVVLFLATLGILCYLSPVVTLILIGFLLLMFLVPVFMGKALQKRQDQYSESLARFTSKAKDYLSGYEVIRSFFIFGNIRKKYVEENKKTAQAKLHADTLIAVNESLADMLSTLSMVVVVFTAAYMVMKGNITAGTLLALIQLSATFSTPVLVLMQNFPKITGMKPILKKMEELSSYLAGEEEKTREPRPFEKQLVFWDVSFGYEEGQEVLSGLDLTIEPGKKYAVQGESGCGKSTFIKLMTGYSHDYEGSIRLDGREVKDIKESEFAGLISVIHQNVYLFDTDVYDNICLGERFTEEEIEQALDKSGVRQFLDKLEDGVHTEVGENGSRLSGGQRQRIAVARALIRKTPILILDEGTSAVDQKTACAIEKDLLEEDGLTLIVITHHMQEELTGYYDKILMMSQGRLRTA